MNGVGESAQRHPIAHRHGQLADQIARLTEMLNAGAISQEVFNKAKDKAYDEQLAGRTDGQAGAIRAFRAYQKEGEDTAGAVEKAFTSAMKATEDAIVNMVTSGEISLNSLNDLANSIVADITRMVVQQSITGPLAKWMGSSMESGGFMSDILGSIFHEGGMAGDMAPSRVITVTEAFGALATRNPCGSAFEMCTRTERTLGKAAIVRASSPSLARQ